MKANIIKEHGDGTVEVELFENGKSLNMELVNRGEARVIDGMNPTELQSKNLYCICGEISLKDLCL